MRNSKKIAALAASVMLCASSVPMAAFAEDAVANSKVYATTLCSDGFVMTRTPATNGDDAVIYPFEYNVSLSKDNVFTITCKTSDKYKTVLPYNESDIGENGYPREILLGAVATNCEGDVDVRTAIDGDVTVDSNWFKNVLWTSMNEDYKQVYGSFVWWNKTYPVAILSDFGNGSETIYDEETHTLKPGVTLAEIKVHDYKLGTPILFNDKFYYADYAEDKTVRIMDSLTDERATAIFPTIKENGDSIIGFYVDEEGNTYSREEWEKRKADLDAKLIAGEISAEDMTHYLTSYEFKEFDFTGAADVYKIVTNGTNDPVKYSNFRATYIDNDGVLTDSSYIVGRSAFAQGKIRCMIDYTASSAFRIHFVAMDDLAFPDGTDIDFGELKFETTKGSFTEELGGVSFGCGDGESVVIERGADIFSMEIYPFERYNETIGESYNHFDATSWDDKKATVYVAGKKFDVEGIHPTLGIANIKVEDSDVTVFPKGLDAATVSRNYRLGDANDSGDVDIMDVIVINKFLLGVGSGINREAADIDGNGDVDSSDSLNTLKLVLDMLTEDDITTLRNK